MFFDKRKYIIPIKGGSGGKNTEGLRGMAVLLIVEPEKDDILWDIAILDMEGDSLFTRKDVQGRLEYSGGIPLGKSKQEKVSILFDNVSASSPIKVILKIKEMDT